MRPCIVLVDPNEESRGKLLEVAHALGCETTTHAAFEAARSDLARKTPAFLVTPIKLGAFNGIHLVHLARQRDPTITCIVYGDDDPGLGHEAQQAGAFYERSLFLPYSLRRYLTSPLPSADRRDPRSVDRRLSFRGGRRATDRRELHATVSSLPRL